MSEACAKAKPSPRVGYVVKRFPRMSETFIINELRALKSLGTYVEVFSLLPPETDQQYALLAELDVAVSYLPDKETLSKLAITEHNYARGHHRKHALRKLVRQQADDVQPPFPGKRFSQCAVLQLQAAALASLAAAKALGHLHAHFASDAGTVAMLAHRLSGLPYSMTAHAKDIFHTYSEPQRDRMFLATKLREASFTVTVSDYNRRYLQKLAAGEAEIHRLYNGTDLGKLQFYQGKREQNLIVAVGRLVEKKGFRYLVDACAWLNANGCNFRCIVIGDGPEYEALAQLIAQHQLQDSVELKGSLPQTEVLQWLRQAAVFALPCVISDSGDRDGLPTVLLESMALGTPAISTNVAGVPEMIDDEKTGWLVEPNDALALAITLQRALAAEEAVRAGMARAARRKAEKLFDLYDNVRILNALFSGQRPAAASANGGAS